MARETIEEYALSTAMPPVVHDDLARWLAHWLAVLPSDACVLELGSGDGRVLRHLRDTYPTLRLMGVEASLIRCGRMRRDGLPCVFTDSPSFPMADQSVDLALSFEVIEHIPPKLLPAYFSEFRRVLKPSGMLWVTTPNYPFKRWVDIRRWLRGERKTWRDDPTHVTRFHWRKLERFLRQVSDDIEVRSSAVPHCDNPARGAIDVKSRWKVYKLHGFAFGRDCGVHGAT